jgi:hypothetical protein
VQHIRKTSYTYVLYITSHVVVCDVNKNILSFFLSFFLSFILFMISPAQVALEKREKAVEEVRWMQEVLKRQLEEEARLVTVLGIRIRNRIRRIHMFLGLPAPGSGSISQRYGSAPICLGSPTLVSHLLRYSFFFYINYLRSSLVQMRSSLVHG